MTIQQFHQAFTASDDSTIAALRRLRERDASDAESLSWWFFWL
jgi:hypothetical protein